MTAKSAGNFSCAATRNDWNVSTDAGMSCYSPISADRKENSQLNLLFGHFGSIFTYFTVGTLGVVDDREHFKSSSNVLMQQRECEWRVIKAALMGNARTQWNSMCRVGSVAEGVWCGQWKSLVSHCACVCMCVCEREMSSCSVCQLMFLVEWQHNKQQHKTALIRVPPPLQTVISRHANMRLSAQTLRCSVRCTCKHMHVGFSVWGLFLYKVFFFQMKSLWMYVTLIYLWLQYTGILAFQLITVCKVQL